MNTKSFIITSYLPTKDDYLKRKEEIITKVIQARLLPRKKKKQVMKSLKLDYLINEWNKEFLLW